MRVFVFSSFTGRLICVSQKPKTSVTGLIVTPKLTLRSHAQHASSVALFENGVILGIIKRSCWSRRYTHAIQLVPLKREELGHGHKERMPYKEKGRNWNDASRNKQKLPAKYPKLRGTQ